MVTVGGDVTFPKTINPFLLSETRKKKEVGESSAQEILDEKDSRWKHLVKEFGPKKGRRFVEQNERQKVKLQHYGSFNLEFNRNLLGKIFRTNTSKKLITYVFQLDPSVKNEKLKSVLEDVDSSTIILPEKLAPKELTPPCNRFVEYIIQRY